MVGSGNGWNLSIGVGLIRFILARTPTERGRRGRRIQRRPLAVFGCGTFCWNIFGSF